MSLLSLAKADINGLSCRLFPFLPRSPHRPARFSSLLLAEFSVDVVAECPLERLPVVDTAEEPVAFRGYIVEEPPNIAETEECAQRACLRIAEVTVMHSVVINAIGSTAMATLVVCCAVPELPLGTDSQLREVLWRIPEGVKPEPPCILNVPPKSIGSWSEAAMLKLWWRLQ